MRPSAFLMEARMRHLSIDIETRSSEDIGKVGLYKYAQSDDFSILLFAYKADGEPVEVINMAQGSRSREKFCWHYLIRK